MDKQRRRLRRIELRLTPPQIVLLWIKKSLSRTYEEIAFQCPHPRAAIAKSIINVVEESLKGEPETVVDGAILQARREAECLYMLVVEANGSVQRQAYESDREYAFLCASMIAGWGRAPSSKCEEALRKVTLAFVERILLLQGTICRLSEERFGGHPILFSDSVEKLRHELALADQALDHFNSLARTWNFAELSKDDIHRSLAPLIDQQVYRKTLLAEGTMLESLGEPAEFRSCFNRLAATYEKEESAAAD